MGSHEEKIELLRKYHNKIRTAFRFHIKGNIPSRIIDNALDKFAFGMDRTTVIGFYDTTLKQTGKSGYIFTDDKVYYLETLDKPKKLWYEDIESTELFDEHKKDSDRGIRFNLRDGTSVEWVSCLLNKTPLHAFFSELILLERAAENEKEALFEAEKKKMNELLSSALSDNRRREGALVISKYSETGRRCIDACFENNGKTFIYAKNGENISIEVPSDKYDEAVMTMEQKISGGFIGGVSQKERAREIVRRGLFTYEQAKNIALYEKVATLSYDEKSGEVKTSSPFGISALITLALSFWGGETIKDAADTQHGAKEAFDTEALMRTASKTEAGRAIAGVSDEILSLLGMGASAALMNAAGKEGESLGAAAVKNAAGLLKNDALSAAVAFMLLSSVDVINIFRGRISAGQLLKNVANSGAAVAGGAAGMLGGAAIGTAIMPGAGTAVGALIGSLAAGGAAGKISDTLMGAFMEDDAEDMLRIIEQTFESIVSEYLLNRKEAERAADGLRENLGQRVLKDMFAAKNRQGFARELIMPAVENEISKRKKVSVPQYMLPHAETEQIGHNKSQEGY
ncbi:MAG: hypothetical protein IJG50_08110 [Clostridia bacterium]|nr:hypothetical protein [Clostridia bacterium]